MAHPFAGAESPLSTGPMGRVLLASAHVCLSEMCGLVQSHAAEAAEASLAQCLTVCPRVAGEAGNLEETWSHLFGVRSKTTAFTLRAGGTNGRAGQLAWHMWTWGSASLQ